MHKKKDLRVLFLFFGGEGRALGSPQTGSGFLVRLETGKDVWSG